MDADEKMLLAAAVGVLLGWFFARRPEVHCHCDGGGDKAPPASIMKDCKTC